MLFADLPQLIQLAAVGEERGSAQKPLPRAMVERLETRVVGDDGRAASDSPQIAQINIHGAIMPEDFGEPCADDCYLDELEDAIDQVAADGSFQAAVLSIESPGGSVLGLEEAGRKIDSLRQQMPVVGYSRTMMASAAYWLGLHADAMFVRPSNRTGSIGAYNYLFDYSRMAESVGIEVVMARSGDLKGMGFPGKPVTETERNHLQAGVDDSFASFAALVAERRGGAVAEDSMRGQCFNGREALARGLVDGLADNIGQAVGSALTAAAA